MGARAVDHSRLHHPAYWSVAFTAWSTESRLLLRMMGSSMHVNKQRLRLDRNQAANHLGGD